MKDINDEEIKDSLGCLKQGELIDMIVDLEKQFDKNYETSNT